MKFNWDTGVSVEVKGLNVIKDVKTIYILLVVLILLMSDVKRNLEMAMFSLHSKLTLV